MLLIQCINCYYSSVYDLLLQSSEVYHWKTVIRLLIGFRVSSAKDLSEMMMNWSFKLIKE